MTPHFEGFDKTRKTEKIREAGYNRKAELSLYDKHLSISDYLQPERVC